MTYSPARCSQIRFDYAFALHTDTRHPHVHIAVRAVGDDGERLNPKGRPGSMAAGVRPDAQGPGCRGRGHAQASRGQLSKVQRAAYDEAAKAAFGGQAALTPWEERLLKRQAKVRGLYLAQAQLLTRSPDAADRALGAEVAAFVRSMPQPDTRRLALAN